MTDHQHNFSRRQFLTTTGTAIAGAGLLGFPTLSAAENEKPAGNRKRALRLWSRKTP